jgi:hypothetical protein
MMAVAAMLWGSLVVLAWPSGAPRNGAKAAYSRSEEASKVVCDRLAHELDKQVTEGLLQQEDRHVLVARCADNFGTITK